MSNVTTLPQPSFSGKSTKSTPPRKPKNADVRNREHLTPGEIDKVVAAADNLGRHGHRDKSIILVMYRHGLRVSELINLRWEQVDFDAGLILLIPVYRRVIVIFYNYSISRE